MFMTIRVGQKLTEIAPGNLPRERAMFTRLDGGPLFVLPDDIDPENCKVSNLTPTDNGTAVMVELNCAKKSGGFRLLYTKFGGPQVLIREVCVGSW